MISLSVSIQYRRVTDRHVSVAKTAPAERRAGKKHDVLSV